jgi:hypothetical protein
MRVNAALNVCKDRLYQDRIPFHRGLFATSQKQKQNKGSICMCSENPNLTYP